MDTFLIGRHPLTFSIPSVGQEKENMIKNIGNTGTECATLTILKTNTKKEAKPRQVGF
jgi:hypothetical protein